MSVNDPQDQDLSQDQSQDQDHSSLPDSEKLLDDVIQDEQAQIEEIDEANEPSEEEDPDAEEDGEGDESEGEGEDEEDGESKGKVADDGKPYQPAKKYSVYGQEKDIPENIQKILTKDNEGAIRDLLTRADGLDEMRTRHGTLNQQHKDLSTNYNTVIGEVGKIMNFKKGGDLDSFFHAVQLTPDQVAAWVMEKARIASLPPEDQRVYNEREAYRRQLLAVQPQIAQAEQTVASSQVQARIQELDTGLSESRVKRAAEEFDQRNGAGAFRKAVMAHGHAVWVQSQKDIPVSEAISGFMKTYGLQLPKAPPKPGAQATRRVVARPKVSTIPNYGGSQASVTGTRKPTSIADLKQMRKDKFGE